MVRDLSRIDNSPKLLGSASCERTTLDSCAHQASPVTGLFGADCHRGKGGVENNSYPLEQPGLEMVQSWEETFRGRCAGHDEKKGGEAKRRKPELVRHDFSGVPAGVYPKQA